MMCWDLSPCCEMTTAIQWRGKNRGAMADLALAL